MYLCTVYTVCTVCIECTVCTVHVCTVCIVCTVRMYCVVRTCVQHGTRGVDPTYRMDVRMRLLKQSASTTSIEPAFQDGFFL